MTVINVAIFQPDARGDTPATRLERLEARLAEVEFGAFDLMLCPELFLSGYDVGAKIHEFAEPADGPSLARVSYLAAKYGTALAIGYPELDGQTLYNALAVVGKSGERLLNYRKRFLPPGFEGETFTPGSEAGFFEFMGQRVAVLICYDVEFPEIVREAAMAGAGIVLAPTALRAKWDFVARKMIPTRAFENGLFLLYANHAGHEGDCEYLGGSVILAPDGRELALAGGAEDVISASLDMADIARARETLPYLEVVAKSGQAV
ncbi:MAG: carbon-nitrogen hydrolase family protein [Rhodospirillales bacterium]|nr:carbon-nitrogen hydrolase family protein [Rhodospirillales bacterium]